jgi:hypothetical protein
VGGWGGGGLWFLANGEDLDVMCLSCSLQGKLTNIE